jgi:hypothetical protein
MLPSQQNIICSEALGSILFSISPTIALLVKLIVGK